MKKVLFSLFLLFLLTGCFNYNELNDYAIVTNMAIDYKNNNYIVTFLISNADKESNSEKEKILYTGKGHTVYEAMKDIDLISPKKIYIGHLSTIILSESSAKKGLYDALEPFMKDYQVNRNFYVVLVKDINAFDILKADTPFTNYPSQYILKNIESSKNVKGSIIAVDFNSLLHKLISHSNNPVINSFSLINDNNNQYLKLSNLGYFKKDKLIGWANNQESKGINIINNTIDNLDLNLKCQDDNIAINISNLKSSISISENTVLIKTTGKADIKSGNYSRSSKHCCQQLEKKINKRIKEYIQQAINLSIKNQVDLFGIEQLYYQKLPKTYKNIKNWDNYYTHENFNIKTNIKLKTTHKNAERILYEKNY